MSARLKAPLGALTLDNPFVNASGTYGYAVEYADFVDVARLGGVSVKGISLEPRPGNAPPRTAETAAGMLNSIGLANIGIEAFVRDTMPRLRELGVTVIANTFATSIEDFVELAKRFDDVEGIAALELNISCPNVHAGGMHFGVSGEAAGEVTSAVREVTSLPLMVKLSPEAGDICEVARAVEAAGADVITMINTIRGMVIDVDRRRPMLGQKMGGMSGPALKPLAVRMLYEVYQQVSIPIIGMGGIGSLRDSLEFFMAGAAAVQVGTANYAEPGISLRLADELDAWLAERDLALTDIIGVAQD
ncbi:MAG: dihydroorotate dehydrogenase [Halieaceae bacterium]|nr:dihydroorotate dehydrogenase [Halieaceae bacterium]